MLCPGVTVFAVMCINAFIVCAFISLAVDTINHFFGKEDSLFWKCTSNLLQVAKSH